MDVLIVIFAGLAGLLVGGLLNVLADDLPHRRSPRRPHYPDGSARPVSAWLGVGAFLTGQRSPSGESAESARLSWRHPLVEIVLALGYMGLVIGYADEPNVPYWFVYLAILLLITVIDVEHRLILFAVILPSCLFALLVAMIAPETDRTTMDYVYGGLLGGGMFFGMFLGGIAFSALAEIDDVAFGFGDVMLAILGGLMIGWRAFIFASLITVFVGALGAVIFLTGRALMRRRHRWFVPLPYGPYIVIGILVMLLFRDVVQDVVKSSVY